MVKVPTAKILVIDDNAAEVDILVTCLGEEGYGEGKLDTRSDVAYPARSPARGSHSARRRGCS